MLNRIYLLLCTLVLSACAPAQLSNVPTIQPTNETTNQPSNYPTAQLCLLPTPAFTLLPAANDLKVESSDLFVNAFYRSPASKYRAMAADGADPVNAQWELGQAKHWYIEQQRFGQSAIIAGIVKKDSSAIDAGLKAFEWGFNHQLADGSFDKTDDAFHSTSFFVEAVARSLLLLQQSPYADAYKSKIETESVMANRAALWMIQSDVLSKGKRGNAPYTHRRYLVAAALGLTGKLTNDAALVQASREFIQEGIALQRDDGANPEKGGYDSSYHAVGLDYAERWYIYLSDDAMAPAVRAMIERGLAWEETRVLASGQVSTDGNTRTAGQETGRNGAVKTVSYTSVITAFGRWGMLTADPHWTDLATRVSKYYIK